jgi:hypothetical protein
MPDKKTVRETTGVFYDTESGKYLPAYPLIWTPSKEIEKEWAKQYHVEILLYCDEYNLLGLLETAILSFLRTYARYNKGIVIRQFAAKYKISDNTLVAAVDRLQDCELADRVCRVDHWGHPNDLVLRPPYSKTELINGHAERLIENVSIEKTRLLRKELGRAFPGNDAYFSEKQISRALGDKSRYAGTFHEFCIEKNYKTSKNKDVKTQEDFKDLYLRAVHYFCQKREIEYTNDLVDAAIAIAHHYGRRASTFH